MSDNDTKTAIDFTTAETYVDAAQQHGEGDDPDHEVGDLQDFFRAAFDLLTDRQKILLSKNPGVRSTLENALCLQDGEIDEIDPPVEQPSGDLKVRVGKLGKLMTRDGREIAGVLESVNCIAYATNGRRDKKGKITVEHDGESDMLWDESNPILTDDGLVQFNVEDGTFVTELDVILVAIKD